MTNYLNSVTNKCQFIFVIFQIKTKYEFNNYEDETEPILARINDYFMYEPQ